MLKDTVKQVTNTWKITILHAPKYISYLDMNKFCSWGMSDYLTYGGFKWLKNTNNFNVNSISKKSSTSYILKVDLKYPD